MQETEWFWNSGTDPDTSSPGRILASPWPGQSPLWKRSLQSWETELCSGLCRRALLSPFLWVTLLALRAKAPNPCLYLEVYSYPLSAALTLCPCQRQSVFRRNIPGLLSTIEDFYSWQGSVSATIFPGLSSMETGLLSIPCSTWSLSSHVIFARVIPHFL